MKTIKKLMIFTFAIILATVCLVPSTYSWYTHNGTSSGNKINYSDNIPISVKSAANTISMTTNIADSNGEIISRSKYQEKNGSPYPTVTANDEEENVGDNVTAAKISVAANAVKYYKTTFTNSGTNDIFVDLNVKTMPNNADFYIGTTSPTVNEKAYASRPVRTKVTGTTVRVYFKTYSGYSSFWSVDNGNLYPNNTVGSSNGTTNDINIAYTVNGTESMYKMTKCPTDDSTTDGGTSKVYYYDVPSNASSFYFFNHWYLCSSTNREWNRTIDITDLTAGKLYFLNGGQVDGQYKAYTARAVDKNLVAVNSYYSNVRMSLGNSVYADIGLKKDSDSEDFIPEYYGASIAYSSASTSIATVNIEGLITPVAQGSTNITTTITGKYGDTKTLTTAVSIPANITEVPIITNVRVPAKSGDTAGSVEIYWYALNKSSSTNMTTGNIYYTI